MRWKKLAYSLIAILAGIVAGGLIGALIGRPAAEGQMLASGAIVFFYLLIGALIGGAFAGFLSYRWTERRVGRLAIGMVVLAVLAWVVVFWLTVPTADKELPPDTSTSLLLTAPKH